MEYVRDDINNKKCFEILINLYSFVFVFVVIIEKLYLSHVTEMFRLCGNGNINLELNCWDYASLQCHSFLEQMSPECVIGTVSHDYAQYLAENQVGLSFDQGWCRNGKSQLEVIAQG